MCRLLSFCTDRGLQKRQKKLQLSGSFSAPLCKGSSAEGGEGLFFYNPPTAAAVSEPVSATPASVLRTLANPFTQGRRKHDAFIINRAAGAPLLFDFLSSLFSPRSGPHLFSSIFSLLSYLKNPACQAGFLVLYFCIIQRLSF